MKTKLFIQNSRQSCKKMMDLLQEKGISFEKINLSSNYMSYDDFKKILFLIDDDSLSLIALNSKEAKRRLEEDPHYFENMTMRQLYYALMAEETMMKTPILIHNNKVAIGYNDELLQPILMTRKERKDRFDKILNQIRKEEDAAGKYKVREQELIMS